MKNPTRLVFCLPVLLAAMPLWAQTTPGTVGKPVQRMPTQVTVRDMSGTPLSDVTVTVSGATSLEERTNEAGVTPLKLADGTYRLRFEREGFITLEREVSIRLGRPREVAVSLSRAPAPPQAPPQASAAPAPPPPSEVPVATAGRSLPPTNVSITEFLEKNFVGREALKESVLGCLPDATARLLQIREPLAGHAHDNVDEVLYVVAGEGALRIGDRATQLTPGSLSTIPRGTAHALERRGRNPLIVLSTLAGAPCQAAAPTAASK